MYCPTCLNEMHCGCAACKERNEAKGLIVNIKKDDFDSCGYCGLTMHMGDWFIEEGRQYDEWKLKKKKK